MDGERRWYTRRPGESALEAGDSKMSARRGLVK